MSRTIGTPAAGERPVDERDLAPNRVGLCLREHPRRLQMGARRGRHLRQEPELVEGQRDTRQEVGAARLADERFPLRKAEAHQRCGVAQRENDWV